MKTAYVLKTDFGLYFMAYGCYGKLHEAKLYPTKEKAVRVQRAMCRLSPDIGYQVEQVQVPRV